MTRLSMAITMAMLFSFFVTRAQDIHFSQFPTAYTHLNPAMTGVFEGNLRATTNYRRQWQSVTADYRTMMISVDANIAQVGKNHSIGIGGSLFRDVAGDLDFSTNAYQFSVSSLLALNEDQNEILAVGFQAGQTWNYYDPTKVITLEDESILFEGHNNLQKHLDLSAGLLYYKEYADNQFIYGGVSGYHLNRPIVSFFDPENSDYRRFRRWVAHFGGNFSLPNSISLIPSLLLMAQGPYRQFTLGSFVNPPLRLQHAKNVPSLMLGAWLRTLTLEQQLDWDAFIVAFRLDYYDLQITFTYDINISSLRTASDFRGGPELSIQYIFGNLKPHGRRIAGETIRRKKGKIKCPKF